MADNHNDGGHGDSVAAWTAVIISMVAFTFGTFALWFNMPGLVVASGVLAVIGVAVGILLARMGYGVNAKNRSN